MNVHLVCNAHLDPAWLWELDEGAAEVLSTFRIAADICDKYENFVFNHNEAILYEWVQEYDPDLFSRIQRLVREGKWHIMGGWFLQPDCNMPSGESFVRQILVGRAFFDKHFGVRPKTAINFDPFGHTRGLVQILAKAGYTSYIACRPGRDSLTLPADTFRWVGYDGSTVVVARRPEGYNSNHGEAAKKIRRAMEERADREHVLVLWGIGNHGGGPSRKDMVDITELQRDTAEARIDHSTPEAFFDAIEKTGEHLPEWHGDLNLWAPGCYTSQIRIKQKHRQLENQLFATERMAVHARLSGLAEYPTRELTDAQYDLLTSQFHDILPGSSIQPVEEASLRLLDHGLEIVSRVQRRLFFALASSCPPPPEEAIPIIAYNSVPVELEGVWECEFQPAAQNWEPTFTDYEVYQDGVLVPSQVEHEASNLNLDWRKKLAIRAVLPASSLSRLICVPVNRPEKPPTRLKPENGRLVISGDSTQVVINAETGLVDELTSDGVSMVKPGAFAPVVVEGDEDPWGSTERSYSKKIGEFTIMSNARGSAFSGLTDRELPSVRVIEEGPVRVVIEALFEYNDSSCILRYRIPRTGRQFDVDVEVNWREKNRMLKLAIPSPFEDAALLGQVAFGTEELPSNGDELITQRWQAITGGSSQSTLAVIDDGVYGSSFADGELRITLLHGPVYSALHIGDRPIVSYDRHHPRIDQGERFFRFRIIAGSTPAVMPRIGSDAQGFNESPRLLSLFTQGDGRDCAEGLRIDDPAVLCSALKRAESDDGFVLRLFNSTDVPRSGRVALAAASLELDYELGPFEVATYRFTADGRWTKTDLMEEEK